MFIFNASIRDNITMFSDFPREEVDRAIEMSGLPQLIAQRGEDYLCGENGSGLSGGEKQRISIARSLLKRYDCVLTLKNGCITESGSFEELMAKKGYFYSLFAVSQ